MGMFCLCVGAYVFVHVRTKSIDLLPCMAVLLLGCVVDSSPDSSSTSQTGPMVCRAVHLIEVEIV